MNRTGSSPQDPISQSLASSGLTIKRRLFPWITSLVTFLVLLLSVSIGPVTIGLDEQLLFLIPGLEADQQATVILEHLRWPRALLALVVGAGLGITGAAMQGVFRNPLADPSILGLSAGASLGAALALWLGTWLVVPQAYIAATQIFFAFLGALLTTAVIYTLAGAGRNGNGRSVMAMLLAGIAITALVGAATSILKVIVPPDQLRQLSLWQMGSLDGKSLIQVLVAGLVIIVGTFYLLRFAQPLNILLLGEPEARYLGVNVGRVKLQIIILVALLVATTVALCGVVGFIGLLAPHSVRLLLGPNHHHVLLNSAITGALMLLAADILARTLFAPIILPVGVVTALVGAPLFLWLLLKAKGGYQWHN